MTAGQEHRPGGRAPPRRRRDRRPPGSDAARPGRPRSLFRAGAPSPRPRARSWRACAGPEGARGTASRRIETLARHLARGDARAARGDRLAATRDAIRDELGDLLLQVVFHAQMASDDGRWDVDDVARRLVEKLIHRHPHVFGDVEVSGADEVLTNWERLKAEERVGSARRRGRHPRDAAGARASGEGAATRGGLGVEWPTRRPALASAPRGGRRALGARRSG